MSSTSRASSHKDGNHLQDGVVKYMSSVPTYLQKLEKGDNVQEKALNFGVLDWSRLEKWTSKQQQTPNVRGGYSPSTSNSSPSPSFSTFESSSQSTRNSNSPRTSHTHDASASTSKGKKFEDFLTRDTLRKVKEKEKCGCYESISMNDEQYEEESKKSFSGITISSGSKSTNCHSIPRSCPPPSTKKTILEREESTCENQKNHVHRTEEGIVKNKLPTHIESKARKELYNSRQAVLKLAWESGLPLFVFSTDNGDILAATMEKAKANCYYMLFSACEIKRRGGFWKNQVSKSKNHGLVYNAVAQMRVSSSEREFVLYGNEVQPSTHTCSTSEYSHELVAVINRVPNEQMLINRDTKQSNFVAIIPEGVHGSSSDGKPLPLIERWRNGGHCDCGGWDEGCSLTILTEYPQEKNISNSRACLQVELLPKGEDKTNKHTFKMDAHEEGVYRVEYGDSIALLQAFAICITILHKKKHRTLTGLHHSMKSYVPSHPPYSPIRRE